MALSFFGWYILQLKLLIQILYSLDIMFIMVLILAFVILESHAQVLNNKDYLVMSVGRQQRLSNNPEHHHPGTHTDSIAGWEPSFVEHLDEENTPSREWYCGK